MVCDANVWQEATTHIEDYIHICEHTWAPDLLLTLVGSMVSTIWLGPSIPGDDTDTNRTEVFNSSPVSAPRPPTQTGQGSTRPATTRHTISTTNRQRTTTGRKWSQSTQTSRVGRGRPVVGEYEAPPSPLLPRAPPTFPFSHSHPHTRTQALPDSRGHTCFLQAKLKAAFPGVETTIVREEISAEAPTTRRSPEPWWLARLQRAGVVR